MGGASVVSVALTFLHSLFTFCLSFLSGITFLGFSILSLLMVVAVWSVIIGVIWGALHK